MKSPLSPRIELEFFRQLWQKSDDPFWLCACAGEDFVLTAVNPAEEAISADFQPGGQVGRLDPAVQPVAGQRAGPERQRQGEKPAGHGNAPGPALRSIRRAGSGRNFRRKFGSLRVFGESPVNRRR